MLNGYLFFIKDIHKPFEEAHFLVHHALIHGKADKVLIAGYAGYNVVFCFVVGNNGSLIIGVVCIFLMDGDVGVVRGEERFVMEDAEA
jgi:hypothetical protein